MKKVLRYPTTYAVLAVAVGLVVWGLLRSGSSRSTLTLSEFQADLGVPGRVASPGPDLMRPAVADPAPASDAAGGGTAMFNATEETMSARRSRPRPEPLEP